MVVPPVSNLLQTTNRRQLWLLTQPLQRLQSSGLIPQVPFSVSGPSIGNPMDTLDLSLFEHPMSLEVLSTPLTYFFMKFLIPAFLQQYHLFGLKPE